jgi:hypothetical protein
MILITVAPVGYRGSWSASIDGRVICASVRLPLVAAAKALLAEGHAPETETAMRHQGSTIVAMQGKIGTVAALTDDAATPGCPSPPHTGSQGGDRAAEGVTLAWNRRTTFLSLSLAMPRQFCLTARATAAMPFDGTGML